jgi:DUF438 domain-containing protein
MDTIKTIDVKKLSHEEKEKLIFPNLEALGINETLRIILDFNPLPLTYMLKARNDFEISYEKEGPVEWILKIKKMEQNTDGKQYLKSLLRDIKLGGAPEETREKAKKLFQSVDAKTLGMVEQELIREGVSHEEIRKSLCDIHLEVLRDAMVSKRIKVSAPHPINTFMEEHKILLENLNQLSLLTARLKDKKSFEDMRDDLEKLKDISHHLVEAEAHHQREEDVLFPKLKEHDVVEPAEIMKMDHVEFRKRKKELYNLVQNYNDYDFKTFKKQVMEQGEYLSKELESHIFKEDNILYQIALQLLNEKEWVEVKKGCDKIGYCCFTPSDQK